MASRKIDTIAIHCSDSPFGDRALLEEWHIARGFTKIGYHAVILNGLRKNSKDYVAAEDGTIEWGRATEEVGAHVEGHNANSLGVCLISKGGIFTFRQGLALASLVARWRAQFGIVPARVLGHREFPGVTKTCPDFEVSFLRSFM